MSSAIDARAALLLFRCTVEQLAADGTLRKSYARFDEALVAIQRRLDEADSFEKEMATPPQIE